MTQTAKTPTGGGDKRTAEKAEKGAPEKVSAPLGPGSIPPVEQLKGRPLGRVLNKMGRVTREQVVVELLRMARELHRIAGAIRIERREQRFVGARPECRRRTQGKNHTKIAQMLEIHALAE